MVDSPKLQVPISILGEDIPGGPATRWKGQLQATGETTAVIHFEFALIYDH